MIRCGSEHRHPISEGFSYFPFQLKIQCLFIQQSQESFKFETENRYIISLMISDLEKQLKLLRQYNKALEDQNNSRNHQRKLLETQIERLSALQKKGCLKFNEQDRNICMNCKLNKIENQRLQQHVRILQSSKQALQNKVTELSEQNDSYQIQQRQQKMNRISSKPILLSEYSILKKQPNSQCLLKQNGELKKQVQEKSLELSKKQRQLRNVQLQNQKRSNQHFVSIKQLNTRIQQMQNALNKSTDDQRSRSQKLESQNKQLVQQLENLQKLLLSYSQTINSLSHEVQQSKRLIYSVPEGYMHQNRQNAYIMSEQLRRVTHINQILTEKIQNQAKSVDSLQERIINLQQLNQKLQSQLNFNTFSFKNIRQTQNIERKSRGEEKYKDKQNLNDNQLKQMIIELQKQIIEMRYPRESSQAKIQVSKNSLSKSNYNNQSMINLTNNCTMPEKVNQNNIISVQKTGRFSPEISTSMGASMGSMSWNQLQIRIKELRSQNSNLKKKLYHHR